MDYDGIDLADVGNGRFTVLNIDNTDFYYCNLDHNMYQHTQYVPHKQNMYLQTRWERCTLSKIRILHHLPQQRYTQELTVDNIIWAHGPRNPSYRT